MGSQTASPPEPPDLAGYAAARGLRWQRDATIVSYAGVFGFGKGDNPNTAWGTLAGGLHGAMGHRRTNIKSMSNQAGGFHLLYEAATFAAVLVPETKTTLSTFEVSQCDTLVDEQYGTPLGQYAKQGDWRIRLGQRTDPAVFAAFWDGELGAWLRGTWPGSRLDVRAGIVSLWVPGYVMDPGMLDGIATAACGAATSLAQLCRPATQPQPFSTALPAPPAWGKRDKQRDDLLVAIQKTTGRFWVETPAVHQQVLDPGATDDRMYGGLRDFCLSYAERRGLEIEDGRTFDRAFPGLPFPGWTQCAWRGMSRAGAPYRIALSAQRSIAHSSLAVIPGAIAIIAEAPAGTPEQALAADDERAAMRSVSGGLRLFWRNFSGLQVDHAKLDAVAAMSGLI